MGLRRAHPLRAALAPPALARDVGVRDPEREPRAGRRPVSLVRGRADLAARTSLAPGSRSHVRGFRVSCPGGAPTFRLLDGLVGWDATAFERLAGPWDPQGIRLLSAGAGGGIPPDAVSPFLPPPRLAYDCVTCTWF